MYQRAHDAQSTPDSTQVLGSRVGRQRWVAPITTAPVTPPPTDTGTDTGTGDTCQSSDCRSDGWQDVASDDDSPADDSDDGTADAGDAGDAGDSGDSGG
jgi:hypothetical protein